MTIAYKRLEEDWFFKDSEEMHQFIMDNTGKGWRFTDKCPGHFVGLDGERYSWSLTVIKPVDDFMMGI